MDRIILHSDLNNFYASAEASRDPSLKGLPIAVAGDEEARHGIVLAKSYEAKKYGVATGDTLWQAKMKCPDIVFIPPDFELYSRLSHAVRKIYDRYTDRVEPYGMDECWLDVTGSERLFCPHLSGVGGAGAYIANEIRETVKKETGLTVSVGVSFNKVFAKLASDMKKPDATTVVTRENFKNTVWPLPVGDLLFVGRKTEARLRTFGISTIGRLAAVDEKFIRHLLGKNGVSLRQSALGLDSSTVTPIREMPPVKSVGNGMTARRDLVCDDDIKIVLYTLCESVSTRLREQNLTCRTVCVSIRDNELFTYDRQGQLTVPTRTAKALFDKAFALVKANRPFGKGIRSLSVRATSLSRDTHEQMSLFPEDDLPAPRENLESTVDRLRAKYGDSTLRRGIMLCGNSPVGADFGLDREVLYTD